MIINSLTLVKTCVRRFVDRFVSLDESKQVVVTYADDSMTMEVVRYDVRGLCGDCKVGLVHRSIN